MSPMLSVSSPAAQRPVSRRGAHIRPLSRVSVSARRGDAITVARPLADYLDAEGRARELFALPGRAGSVLVLDRDAATLCDRRLVAHLAADEPRENVEIICRHYLEDTSGRWCRRVQPEDLEDFASRSNADPKPMRSTCMHLGRMSQTPRATPTASKRLPESNPPPSCAGVGARRATMTTNGSRSVCVMSSARLRATSLCARSQNWRLPGRSTIPKFC